MISMHQAKAVVARTQALHNNNVVLTCASTGSVCTAMPSYDLMGALLALHVEDEGLLCSAFRSAKAWMAACALACATLSCLSTHASWC